ncbi:hypothetical protein KDL01_19470 [Actinospica durhamensis]|uniref:Uncharacterized protein n=1 Tax=Actinospica durhamensis TaxID=1508375 RepID=A0A941EUU9_9ACTN|nr:hypothetical protein [Actinospica durhamensis]MBR7835464.1 hypothetical protein [Actinospica durhamensis]
MRTGSPRARVAAANPYEEQRDRLPAVRTLAGWSLGSAVIAEVCLALVGGGSAAAVGLAVIGAAIIAVLCYVAGAEVLDGQYRKPLRLVRKRHLSMLGWTALVSSARSSATGFAHGARPELQRLYAVRLAEKHGVSLLRDPEKAAALIGPELWPWIDPSRPAPMPATRAPHLALDRRSGAGAEAPPPDAVLLALVDRLEQL